MDIISLAVGAGSMALILSEKARKTAKNVLDKAYDMSKKAIDEFEKENKEEIKK